MVYVIINMVTATGLFVCCMVERKRCIELERENEALKEKVFKLKSRLNSFYGCYGVHPEEVLERKKEED